MPRYKYTCETCGLGDVKKFLYRYDEQTGQIDLKVCEECGTPVERVWSKPPDSWYRSIRRPNE